MESYIIAKTDRCGGKGIGKKALAIFVNLMAIHDNFFGSVDTDSHFPSLDGNYRYSDIVTDNDFFPDFSR